VAKNTSFPELRRNRADINQLFLRHLNRIITCQHEFTTTAKHKQQNVGVACLRALYLMDSRQGSFVPAHHSSPPSRPFPSESSLGLKIKERETACSHLPQLQDSSLWHDILLLEIVV
jgi:hypothetical protein